MSGRVLVIGLDGATFRIIEPLVKQGRLPTCQRLLEKGAYGPLLSTPDANSPCAWSSFITGKNPGKHGIFGFFEPVPNSYEIRFLNGSFRSGKPLWRLLSEQGKRVCVVNVPFSYPAEAVDSILIAGADSPSKTDPQFAHPAGILEELEEKVGEYLIEAGASALVRQGKVAAALKKLDECIAARVAVAKYLLAKDTYDLFMVVFTESDRVQHHFWKYLNPRHPAYESEARKEFGSAIYDIYERLDRALAEIIDAAGDDYAVLVMSDHGAGPASNRTFFLNRWLAHEGYLSFRQNTSVRGRFRGLFEWALSRAYIHVNSKFSRRWKRTLRNVFPGVRDKASSVVRGLQIDWEGTKAFSWENAPAIYVNLRGKFPAGTVAPGEEYEDVMRDLEERLLSLTCPETGDPLVARVQRKQELCWGPYVDRAADLLIEWKDDGCTVRPGYASKGQGFMETMEGARLQRVETISRASGVHRPEGVLLFCGEGAARGRPAREVHLYDVTATILYYLGVDVPSDWDGHVIQELFTDGFLADHPVGRSDDSTDRAARDLGYSDGESAVIQERLQGLGYID